MGKVSDESTRSDWNILLAEQEAEMRRFIAAVKASHPRTAGEQR